MKSIISHLLHLLIFVSVNLFAQSPVADFTANNTTTCEGGCVNFTDLSTNAPGSLEWDFGDGTVSTLQNPQKCYAIAGTYTISLIATNASGSDTKTMLNYITVFPAPVVSISPSAPIICFGDSVTLIPSVNMQVTYVWSPPDGLSGTIIANPTAFPSSTTTYTLLVTSLEGCTNNENVTVTVAPAINISVNATHVSCPGLCDGEISVFASGGTPPYAYEWNPGGIMPAVVTGICPGTYTVLITDVQGCQKLDSVTINGPPQILINASSSDVSCIGYCNGSVSANVSGGSGSYTYLWMPGGITVPNYSNLCPGIKTLFVTDDNGCTDSASVIISEPLAIVSNISGTDVSCYGFCDGQASVSPTGGNLPYSYQWSPAGMTTSIVAGICMGTYTVLITDVQGCQKLDSITINGPSPIVSNISGTDVSCSGFCDGQAAVNPTGGNPLYTYQWNNGVNAPQISGACSGTYVVLITDEQGCQKMDTVIINEQPQILISFTTIQPSCGQCDGLATVYPTGGTAPYFYSWNTIPVQTGQTAVFCYIVSPFIVTVTDSDGCEAIDSLIASSNCDSIWPGDANNDMIANNDDLLPIGIAYGETGPVRTGASILWEGQVAENWMDTLSTGVNFKHIDTNGDGIINSDDTLAIYQNYGLIHQKWPASSSGSASDPEIYFEFPSDTIGQNQEIEIMVYFGTSTNEVTDVYGIAFSIDYDPLLVDSGSVRMDPEACWMGDYGISLISFQKDMYSFGRLDAAITRINQTNTSGYGPLAKITIVTTDNLAGKTGIYQDFSLSISNLTIISINGDTLNANVTPGSVVVTDQIISVNESEKKSSLKVYPNPATSVLNVVARGFSDSSAISITDVLGRQVLNKRISSGNNVISEKIDVSMLNAGVYFISLEKQAEKVKLIITKN
ncbi:MAG: T9SS type A sorting domain-containing protein [Bacteroidetes bacterium]|nr:T9SS type A sorting domain-containing protein [Bacteroidota bacterium]HET6244359.1 PKD domain-containing protein [Bacteroidia bacterium]